MATKYGYKLDPYRQLRKQKGIKGVRRTILNSHNPSTIDQGRTLTVRFPDLGRNYDIVPGTSMLSFKVNLNSSGGSADANRTIVNNLGRAIVSKVVVTLEGKEFTRWTMQIYSCAFKISDLGILIRENLTKAKLDKLTQNGVTP